jgi:hypothetical protein
VEEDDALNLDFGKKKKKKSKAKDAEAPAEGAEGAAPPPPEEEDDLNLDLSLGKKKKKKKAKARAEDDFGGLDAEGGEEGTQRAGGLPWEGSDRDYTYEELLGERGRQEWVPTALTWQSRCPGEVAAKERQVDVGQQHCATLPPPLSPIAARSHVMRPQTACLASSRPTTRS